MFDLMPFDRRNFKDMQRFFDGFEKNLFGWPESFGGFKTDIIDQGSQYVLEAELPGFAKEDLNIDIDGDRLTISAQHTAENEEKNENFVRRERSYGSYSRSFDISNIKAEAITAEYKNGVLFLTMPKNDQAAEKSRRIQIQ
ncbi:Hsp20/alpha crystallin family protein [Acetanaerobacterium elongatum]|uniref:HSP20 family protein n=1 Tax=Acetanaerobacterium elongatum TaxID=258515 RepID=A0A1H0GC67_9FIRM|nr:Hsp20/alpha crystallin family protein [Acetanaerobacterium elongatum]SDO04466.1 HSP20 family protein [Acetanaerobacterium elongatum]